MMRAAILSANYTPGHFSHMTAYYKMFEDLHCESVLCLHDDYRWMVDEYRQSNDLRCLFLSGEYVQRMDILLIYNLSLHDTAYIRRLKSVNPDLKILFVYHEPWQGYGVWIENLTARRESLFDNIKLLGAYLVGKSVVKQADKILLPSKQAEAYYLRGDVRLNASHTVFPLIFTDEAAAMPYSEKKYFSFISTAQNSKNFDEFLEYMLYRAKKNRETLFQIATRTDISRFLTPELKKLIDSGRLRVLHGKPLSNQEINQAYALSNCSWILYRKATQSGVLCKSFMFGAPVIASDVGNFSEIIDGRNGTVLEEGYTLSDIDRAYEAILADLERYSIAARQTFLKRFDYRASVAQFSRIMETL